MKSGNLSIMVDFNYVRGYLDVKLRQKKKTLFVVSSWLFLILVAIPFMNFSDKKTKELGGYFAAAKVRGCGPDDDAWMKMIHLAMPDASVFIDIGSNKGYTAMRFFSYWSPFLNLNPRSHYKRVSTSDFKDIQACGVCNDCRENQQPFIDVYARVCGVQKTSHRDEQEALVNHTKKLCETKKSIHVYSYDGNAGLISHCSQANENLNWHLQVGAFVDNCEGDFVRFLSNGELGHVMDDQGQGQSGNMVECFTLDKLDFERVDILKIDAEGFDGQILHGGRKMLKKVELVMFEYSHLWPTESTLLEVVSFLETYNFHCFLEGKNLLVDLSSWSWDPTNFDRKQWSNVYCPHKGSLVAQLFVKYTIDHFMGKVQNQ